jgi:hypothetical protein
VRVTQACDCLRLVAEAGQFGWAGAGSGQDHLQGDQALQGPLPRLVDHAHAAPAQLGQDLIAGYGWERRGAGQGRGRLGQFGSAGASGKRGWRIAGDVAAAKVGRGRRGRELRRESVPDPGGLGGETDLVLGRGGPLALCAAILGVQQHQLMQQRRPFRPRRVAEEVLDPGPAAGLPGELKPGTHAVQVVGEGRPQPCGGRRGRVGHRAISCSHSVRIKRIFRLIVRAT